VGITQLLLNPSRAGCAADVEDKRAAGREGGRASDIEDKRKAGRAGDAGVKRVANPLSGLLRSVAARQRHGQDDAATIAATANISRSSSVRDRVEKAKRMTVRQAMRLNIYNLKQRNGWVYLSCTHLRPESRRLLA
jgi:hypothetical protein